MRNRASSVDAVTYLQEPDFPIPHSPFSIPGYLRVGALRSLSNALTTNPSPRTQASRNSTSASAG